MGAPYIYDISRLRVKSTASKNNPETGFYGKKTAKTLEIL